MTDITEIYAAIVEENRRIKESSEVIARILKAIEWDYWRETGMKEYQIELRMKWPPS